jgi:hypothetical protein
VGLLVVCMVAVPATLSLCSAYGLACASRGLCDARLPPLMALHCCGPIPAFAPWLLLIAMCARNTFGNCGFQVPTLHSYADNIVALRATVDELATANLNVVSGSGGVLGPSTTAQVCVPSRHICAPLVARVESGARFLWRQ